MSFWKQLFSGSSTHKSADYSSFVKKATQGSADCEIGISEWLTLWDAFATALVKSEMAKGNDKVVQLINKRLIGVCPKCHILFPGQGLAMLAVMRDCKVFIGAPPDAYRVFNGRCRNESCSCRRMLIFWKHDEDRGTMSRLAGMGIMVRPKL